MEWVEERVDADIFEIVSISILVGLLQRAERLLSLTKAEVNYRKVVRIDVFSFTFLLSESGSSYLVNVASFQLVEEVAQVQAGRCFFGSKSESALDGMIGPFRSELRRAIAPA